MSGSDVLDTRDLLAESAWLARLTRRLVHDPAAADDAAQEALLVVSRTPGGERPSRRWLASVLRNFVRHEQRAARTRRRIEAAAGREAADDSADEVAARLEIQRRLIEAVQALDEPYRSTITLRFLESLPPREVARRMHVPVKTVHTRVERGLARLRSKLDRSYRGRSEWLSVLAPLTLRRAGLALPGLGVLMMSSTVKWTLTVLGILLVGWFVQPARSVEVPPAVGSPAEVAEAPRAATSEVVPPIVPASVPSPGARVAVLVPRDEAVIRPLAMQFDGRVVDVTGRPVGGVRVRFEPIDAGAKAAEPAIEPAESDAGGGFTMELPSTRGRLVGSGGGFAPVVSPGISSNLPIEPPVVVVGPMRSYAGVVRDEDGAGLAGVELAIALDRVVAERLHPGGLSRVVPVARSRTADDGSFAFPSVGFVEGSVLRCELSGYRAEVVELPAFSSRALDVVLVRRHVDPTGVAGRVQDRDGLPVAGAHVSAGQFTTTTDARGEFVLDLEGAVGKTLRAVAPGWLPASIALPDLDPEQRASVVLQLGEAGRSIRGRVLDRDGAPIVEAQVWTFDGEHFGFVPERIGDVEFRRSMDVEQMIAGDGRDGRETTSQADGSFELRGLADRPYALYAMHPVTQCVGRVVGVDSGAAGIVIRLREDERCAPVVGRVLGLGGDPVEGAVIRVYRQFADAQGRVGMRSARHDFHATTDANGRFRFERLAIEGTSLALGGEMVPSAQTIALAAVLDLENIEFLVPSRCHIRVLLESDASFASSFELLDANGTKLNISFMRGGVNLGAQAVGIVDGSSPLTQTDESARTIVLFGREGLEVYRQQIRLDPARVNELRF